MKKVRIREVEPYIKKLGLKWRVRFIAVLPEETGSFQGPTIISDGNQKVHTIQLSESWFQNRYGKYEIVHELCHAQMAEAISPLFATHWFHPNCRQFVERPVVNNQFFLSVAGQQDLWVNEFLWQIDSALIKSLGKGFLRQVEMFLKGRYYFYFSQRALLDLATLLILNYGVNWAMVKRCRLSTEYTQALLEINSLMGSAFGRDCSILARELGDYFAELPRLDFRNKNCSLRYLEQSVQDVIKIFGFAISAEIVRWQGQERWLLRKI